MLVLFTIFLGVARSAHVFQVAIRSRSSTWSRSYCALERLKLSITGMWSPRPWCEARYHALPFYLYILMWIWNGVVDEKAAVIPYWTILGPVPTLQRMVGTIPCGNVFESRVIHDHPRKILGSCNHPAAPRSTRLTQATEALKWQTEDLKTPCLGGADIGLTAPLKTCTTPGAFLTLFD